MNRQHPTLDSDVTMRWSWYFTHVNIASLRRQEGVLRRLEAARLYLDQHLDEPLSLDEIAKHAHLSKFHFLRMFKEVFHETPLSYQRRRRMEAAQRLLTRTETPVTSVCFQVGFESLGSFSSLFRRFTAMSPIVYRRRYVVVPRTIIAPEKMIPHCWLSRYAPSATGSLVFS